MYLPFFIGSKVGYSSIDGYIPHDGSANANEGDKAGEACDWISNNTEISNIQLLFFTIVCASA